MQVDNLCVLYEYNGWFLEKMLFRSISNDILGNFDNEYELYWRVRDFPIFSTLGNCWVCLFVESDPEEIFAIVCKNLHNYLFTSHGR